MPNDETPLGEARAWLRDRVDDGEKCPCCTQFAKVYRRKITSPMARGLIKQYRIMRQEYAHSASLAATETHEFSQLSWWGLIEELEERRDDGGRAGWWHITDNGRRFVLNQITVPKYARIYDSRVLSLDDAEHVSIVDALGIKFNYRDLMDGI